MYSPKPSTSAVPGAPGRLRPNRPRVVDAPETRLDWLLRQATSPLLVLDRGGMIHRSSSSAGDLPGHAASDLAATALSYVPLPEKAGALSRADVLSTVGSTKAAGLRDADGEIDMAGQAGSGTKADPWILQTPPGTSGYTMYLDEGSDPPSIVCQVGVTQLRYDRRAIDDLHAKLKAHGDWMPLGGADEQKPAPDGSVEAWGRSADNPIGGWYGLKKGLRGRFGVYMPPLLEALGLAELTHEPKNNRMRAR